VPTIHRGIAGSLTVTDSQAAAAVQELTAARLIIGESRAAALAGLRDLHSGPRCSDLRERLGVGGHTSAAHRDRRRHRSTNRAGMKRAPPRRCFKGPASKTGAIEVHATVHPESRA
jgi:threonine dehydratase